MSGKVEIQIPDCPAEAGGECAMPQRRGWHLDRGINPAYIIPLVGAILAGLAWAGEVNRRDSVQDNTLLQHAQEDKNTEARVDKLERRTDDQLKAINDKLDRLIERGR